MCPAEVILIGDAATGKTSLRHRFLHSVFTRSYKATIGADFVSKQLQVEDAHVRLQLWDTAGQERFRSLGTAFYRGADAVMLVFSIIDRSTMQHIAEWFEEFKMRCPVQEGREQDMTWICIGTKLDLVGEAGTGEPATEEQVQAMLDKLLPRNGQLEEEEDGASTPTLQDFMPPVALPPHYPASAAAREQARRPRPELPLEELEDDWGHESRPIDILPPAHFRMRQPSNASRGQSTNASIYHTPQGSISASSSWTPTDILPSPPLSPSELLDDAPTPRASTPATVGAGEYFDGSSTESAVEPPRPQTGFKLFFTSAKTGAHVNDPFEYCATQIHARQRYQKWLDAQLPSDERSMSLYGNLRRGSVDSGPIKVGAPEGAAARKWKTAGCCGY